MADRKKVLYLYQQNSRTMIITKDTQEIFSRQRAERKECNDCAVRATAIALNMDYEVVHALYEMKGRERGRGVRTFQIKDVVKGQLIGANFDTIHEMADEARWERKKFPTLTNVLKRDKFKTGTHLILTTGHCLTIKDGVVYGNSYEGARSRVSGYITTENK